MSTYKITNISNTIGKRELKYNSILNFDYVDEMTKKTITVKPGESVYLTISLLPLSLHKLRLRKLVTVIEISQSELLSVIEKNNKPKLLDKTIENIQKSEEIVKTSGKKKDVKKE